MSMKVEIIADSINPAGQRLTTFLLHYERIVLAEINTHRAMSRCTASSRAIPVKKRIAAVKEDPYIPLKWGMNEKGMQSNTEADSDTADKARALWLGARDQAVNYAEMLVELGIHKQFVNRLLETFSHVSTVISATEWSNFFSLRCSPKAMPEMQALAYAMAEAYRNSKPRQARWGDWHLPFIKSTDITDAFEVEKSAEDAMLLLAKASAMRCARVSYENHDGCKVSVVEDAGKCEEMLIKPFPRHASPCEHPAYARSQSPHDDYGNFKGWRQLRKTFTNENIKTFPWETKNENEVSTVKTLS
jgi:thymidylate synthase ThyX